jgi:hypothetical protein
LGLINNHPVASGATDLLKSERYTIGFRLARGPVPHLTEQFALTDDDGGTRLECSGEFGTDFDIAGRWWAGRVAAAWEAAVRSSFRGIQAEAERCASPGTAQSDAPASASRAPPPDCPTGLDRESAPSDATR